jgi:hypothetical protein
VFGSAEPVALTAVVATGATLRAADGNVMALVTVAVVIRDFRVMVLFMALVRFRGWPSPTSKFRFVNQLSAWIPR